MATLLLAMAAIALTATDHAASGRAVALLAVAFLTRPVEGVRGLAMLVVPAGEIMGAFGLGQNALRGQGSRLLVLLVGVPAASVVLVALAARYLPILQASMAGNRALIGHRTSGYNLQPFPGFDSRLRIHYLLAGGLGPDDRVRRYSAWHGRLDLDAASFRTWVLESSPARVVGR